MKEEELRSYILLMMYRFKEFIRDSLHIMDIDIKEENTQFESLNFDIYKDDLDPEGLSMMMSVLKAMISVDLFDNEPRIMHHYFNAHNFKFTCFDIDIVVKRYVFLVNKYFHINYLISRIFDNYLQLKKHQKDIEIGTKKFNDILLKNINKDGEHLSSDYAYKTIRDTFYKMKTQQYPVHNRVLNNIPFDALKETKTENYDKVLTILKRKLTAELIPYIDSTIAKVTNKQKSVGLALIFSGLSYNEEQFIQSKKEKDLFYQYDEKDFLTYQRTEGKNAINSLSNSR